MGGGCASLQTPGVNPNERIYRADLQSTIEEVVHVLDYLNLNIEEQSWAEPDTRYEISGYELGRVFRSTSEGTVRTATVLIVIESQGAGQTRVTMETTRQDRPSMASRAGDTADHERTFFARLDEVLPLAPAEEPTGGDLQP
jgi:hypothetical protein